MKIQILQLQGKFKLDHKRTKWKQKYKIFLLLEYDNFSKMTRWLYKDSYKILQLNI